MIKKCITPLCYVYRKSAFQGRFRVHIDADMAFCGVFTSMCTEKPHSRAVFVYT